MITTYKAQGLTMDDVAINLQLQFVVFHPNTVHIEVYGDTEISSEFSEIIFLREKIFKCRGSIRLILHLYIELGKAEEKAKRYVLTACSCELLTVLLNSHPSASH
jgi:hypothetical protein